MKISTDIGYGHTKYAISEQNKINKFPSAVSRISGNFNLVGEKKAVDYNGDHFFVGEEATNGTNNIIPTRSVDFLISYSPLFLSYIFKTENIKPDTVCLSLSIAEYRDKQDKLKAACSKFIVSEELFEQDIIVFPQGIGIWVNEGKPKNALIVDIGYNTVDVLVIKNGSVSAESSSGFTDIGTCIITNAISDRIRSEFNGYFLSEIESNKILLDKEFKYLRKSHDLTDFIYNEQKNYTSVILNAVFSKPDIKNFIAKTDVFIVAGGGAYYINENVKEENGMTIPDKPEFANVTGFLKLMEEK